MSHEYSGSYDVHALSGAYAVDALDDLERAAFERHLAECPECRAEVDSLREAASLLGLTIETVSRQLTALENEGLIRKDGLRGIHVFDAAALTAAMA